jgi:hypothetical protein
MADLIERGGRQILAKNRSTQVRLSGVTGQACGKGAPAAFAAQDDQNPKFPIGVPTAQTGRFPSPSVLIDSVTRSSSHPLSNH